MKLSKEKLVSIIKEELDEGMFDFLKGKKEKEPEEPPLTDLNRFEEKLYRNLKESFDMLTRYELDTDQHLNEYHQVVKDLVFNAMKHLEQQRAELRKPRTRGTG